MGAIVMFDFLYTVDFRDHILEFNGVDLISAKYEPDWGCLYDVEFSNDYFVAGDTEEKVEITTRYRGLRGTMGYQVDLFIGDNFFKTMMIQTTPVGYIYADKDKYSLLD
jgi:hypothetical protein